MATISTTTMLDYIGDGGPDGTCVGRSATDKVGFYGATPAAQQAVGSLATFSNTSLIASTTSWGFSTSTAALAAQAALVAIMQALKNLGLSS